MGKTKKTAEAVKNQAQKKQDIKNLEIRQSAQLKALRGTLKEIKTLGGTLAYLRKLDKDQDYNFELTDFQREILQNQTAFYRVIVDSVLTDRQRDKVEQYKIRKHNAETEDESKHKDLITEKYFIAEMKTDDGNWVTIGQNKDKTKLVKKYPFDGIKVSSEMRPISDSFSATEVLKSLQKCETTFMETFWSDNAELNPVTLREAFGGDVTKEDRKQTKKMNGKPAKAKKTNKKSKKSA